MGLDFDDAEGIEPELLERAKAGEAKMTSTVDTEDAALEISGGSDAQRSFDEVIQKSQNDLTKVRQVISQGGFKGPEKDKYTMSLHHAEWIHSRNLYMKCDNNIQEKSVKYTALVNGKAEDHKIVKAYKEWTETRTKCRTSSTDLIEKASQYIETDRRVRANKKADGDIYPTIGQPEPFMVRHGGGVEGFGEVREGFDFYNESTAGAATKDITGVTGLKTYNARLPLLTDTSTTNNDKTLILTWGDYYTDCGSQAIEKQALCNDSNRKKDKLINTINILFDRADKLINTYYKLKTVTTTSLSTALEIS